jgi:hypothetical protein
MLTATKCSKLNSLLPVLLWIGVNNTVWSAPITFNTALPVAKNEFIFRQQFVVGQSGHDPDPADRDRTAWASVSVLGYGVSSKLALFGILPYVNKSLDITVSKQRFNRQGDGLGDVSLFGRYTVFQMNWPGRTFRIAPFAGFKAPTGKNNISDNLGRLPFSVQPGTGSWDAFGGMVTTWQTLDYQVDGQFSYRGNGKAKGFAAGDQIRLDTSLQYRFWPGALTSNVFGFLYGVLESNLLFQEKNQINNRVDHNSGGSQWFLTPGLQYVTQRWIVEAAVQIPVVQQLNGTALENSYIVRAGFRFNF